MAYPEILRPVGDSGEPIDWPDTTQTPPFPKTVQEFTDQPQLWSTPLILGLAIANRVEHLRFLGEINEAEKDGLFQRLDDVMGLVAKAYEGKTRV